MTIGSALKFTVLFITIFLVKTDVSEEERVKNFLNALPEETDVEKGLAISREELFELKSMLEREGKHDIINEIKKNRVIISPPSDGRDVTLQYDDRELQFLVSLRLVFAIAVYFFAFGTIDFPLPPSASPSISSQPTFFTPQPTPVTPKPTTAPSLIKNFIEGIQQINELIQNFLKGVISEFDTNAPSLQPSVSLMPSITSKPSKPPSIAPSMRPSLEPTR